MYLHPSRLVNQIKPATCGLQRLFSTDFVRRKEVPSNAEIVVAGAGAVGSSVAYHLSKCGWKDVLLLEQGQAGCGTSWHAAGLCGTIRGTSVQTEIALYAVDLYSKLEEETGVATGFKRCGSLNVATTKGRALSYKRLNVLANQCGVECHVVGKKEAGALNPFLNTEGVEMALWVPNDGVIDPANLVQAYLKGATKNGATRYIEGVEVNGLESNGRNVTAVETNFGRISCDKFINCAGLWAWELGQVSKPPVEIPLHACEHFYVITKALDGMDSMLPVTRDYDSYTYLREWSGGLMGGGFEPNAKGTFFKKIPDNFHFQLLEEDWDQFQIIMDGLILRYPCFSNAEICQYTNGPESFTPDGLPYVSKSKEFSNYFIAAGLNSNGIINSAGVGKAMAELVTYGESATNIHAFDVRRITPSSNNKLFCHDKAAQTLSGMYEMSYPTKFSGDVSVSNSPIHCLLENKGAVWGEHAGWPRPLFFKLEDNETHVSSFGKPSWLENVQTELKSLEQSVGIFDFSSNSKFNLRSVNSEPLTNFLQQTCLYKGFNQMKSGDIVGTIVHNKRKSPVSCVDVLKVDENTVMMITGAEQHIFLLSHLKDVIDEDKSNIVVEDVTGKYASFGLIGPNVEDLLNNLLSPPYSTSSIRPDESHIVDIGYATSVTLCRHLMEFEKGWKMIIPSQYSQGLYTMLMKTGQKYGIRNIGHLALDTFRVSNMTPAYGSEIGPLTDSDMLESFCQNEKKHGMSLMLVEIIVPTVENWPWGGEPVLVDGHHVGSLSSLAYSQENDKVLGLVLLDRTQFALGTDLTIQVGGDQYHGKVVKIN